MVDQNTIKQITTDQDNVKEIDNDRNRVDNVRNVKYTHPIVRQLILFVRQEKTSNPRHHIRLHRRYQSQVHRNVKHSSLNPSQHLHKIVIQQLEIEHARVTLVRMLVHVVKGKPRTVYPTSTLTEQTSQRCHRVHYRFGIRQVVQSVTQSVNPQTHNTILSQIHVGVFKGNVQFL